MGYCYGGIGRCFPCIRRNRDYKETTVHQSVLKVLFFLGHVLSDWVLARRGAQGGESRRE